MAAPNFGKPVVGDNYVDVLPYVVDNVKGLAQGLDPAVITGGGTPAGTPAGAIRWNSANKYWEKYNGSVWAALDSTYAIAITGNAGTVTNGVYTSGSYSNPAWITALVWSKLTSTPTTLAGYGIADGITAAAVAAGYAAKATTLAGYSIADAAPLSHVGAGGAAHANAVAAGAAGFLTGADKTKLDNTSGTNTGDQTSVTGNAGTATALQTARTINGVSFDGTANISIAVPAAASQAEEEAASSTTVFTTPGRQQYHPGVAKAWCKLTGTGWTKPVSYNVSSITDNGVGDFTVNFGTAFSSGDYSVSYCMLGDDSSYGVRSATVSATNAPTTSACRIYTGPTTSVSKLDVNGVFLSFFGDQ